MSKQSKKTRKAILKIKNQLKEYAKSIPDEQFFYSKESPYYWQYITYKQLTNT